MTMVNMDDDKLISEIGKDAYTNTNNTNTFSWNTPQVIIQPHCKE